MGKAFFVEATHAPAKTKQLYRSALCAALLAYGGHGAGTGDGRDWNTFRRRFLRKGNISELCCPHHIEGPIPDPSTAPARRQNAHDSHTVQAGCSLRRLATARLATAFEAPQTFFPTWRCEGFSPRQPWRATKNCRRSYAKRERGVGALIDKDDRRSLHRSQARRCRQHAPLWHGRTAAGRLAAAGAWQRSGAGRHNTPWNLTCVAFRPSAWALPWTRFLPRGSQRRSRWRADPAEASTAEASLARSDPNPENGTP